MACTKLCCLINGRCDMALNLHWCRFLSQNLCRSL